MDFQVVRENALKYLGYQAPMFEGLTLGISSLLGECIEEIEQIAQPKVIVKRFKLAKDPLRLELIHEYGCAGLRIWLRWVTNMAASGYEYG